MTEREALTVLVEYATAKSRVKNQQVLDAIVAADFALSGSVLVLDVTQDCPDKDVE